MEIKQKRLLSIIVPLHNAGKYIEETVTGIIGFNHGNLPFEIVLVDDGSTDNTAEICNKLETMYYEIRYFKKENEGIASARNKGLEYASGEYITFCDQDDVIIKGYKAFVDRCISEKLDILITSPYNKRKNDSKMNQRIFAEQTATDKMLIKKIAGKLIDGNYFSDDTVPFVSTSVWNVIYRRETLQKNGIHFKSFIDYEDDWIFNIESLLCAEKIAISSEGYYCWVIRDTSESHRNKYIPDLLIKRKNWMNWLSEIIKELDVEPEKEREFIRDVLIPRNIMMCFNNACWHEGVDKNARLQEIEEAISPEGWDINTVESDTVKEMSFSNRAVLRLLKKNHVKLAYYLNRSIFNNHFH